MRTETGVIIVGGGPSGLAVAACLEEVSIPYVVLEREDCHSSLWKYRAYDRLRLNLAKEFCALPRMPHPSSAPTYIHHLDFVKYLDRYVDRFGLRLRLRRSVQDARREGDRWVVAAKAWGEREAVEEYYEGRYLVVATGENGEGYVPELEGLEAFHGEVLHSSDFKSGAPYHGKSVLVVGCGNSGMEIAYDFCSHGAFTSIVIRNSFHMATKGMVRLGMTLLAYKFPLWLVDTLILLLIKFKFGDLSRYGIVTPREGPFALRDRYGRTPVIDVGTLAKIKSGEIQVVADISSIKGKEVVFTDGKSNQFDVIVFATGYKSTALSWLKDGGGGLLDEEGMPKKKFPNHWKGENGIYCVGLSKRGPAVVTEESNHIANDIKKDYFTSKERTK